jgi:hypothetical protein
MKFMPKSRLAAQVPSVPPLALIALPVPVGGMPNRSVSEPLRRICGAANHHRFASSDTQRLSF